MNKIAAIAWYIMFFILFGHPFLLLFGLVYFAIAIIVPAVKPEWKKYFR